MVSRRGFLGAILAAAAAPAIVRAESIMRVRPLVLPGDPEFNLVPYPEEWATVDLRSRAYGELARWWVEQFDRLAYEHLANVRLIP